MVLWFWKVTGRAAPELFSDAIHVGAGEACFRVVGLASFAFPVEPKTAWVVRAFPFAPGVSID